MSDPSLFGIMITGLGASSLTTIKDVMQIVCADDLEEIPISCTHIPTSAFRTSKGQKNHVCPDGAEEDDDDSAVLVSTDLLPVRDLAREGIPLADCGFDGA
jgi:hypothetical protein